MGDFVQELFRVGFYKRSQGRIARQATFAALAIIVLLASWSMNRYYAGRLEIGGETVQTAEGQTFEATSGVVGRYVAPAIVLVVGLWASFRVVQMPSFADFLISVEAEMNKVAWPARGELSRASTVVIVMIFVLAFVLFAYDAIWRAIFEELLG